MDEQFESVDLSNTLTEDFVFQQLSGAFVVLENLISGSKNAKENLERIYDLLSSIKSIMNDFREGLISMGNINDIAQNMEQLDKTLKLWVSEEIKMISVINAVLTEQREIKELITKSSKKRIVEDAQVKQTSGGSNTKLIIIVIALQVVSFCLLKWNII